MHMYYITTTILKFELISDLGSGTQGESTNKRYLEQGHRNGGGTPKIPCANLRLQALGNVHLKIHDVRVYARNGDPPTKKNIFLHSCLEDSLNNIRQ